MNRIQLMGRLGNDPETRQVNETSVTSFSLATTQKYKDKETTQWHRVTAWGKQGEVIAKYVKKGQRLLLEGRVEYQEYEKDGVKRQSTNIVLESFHFIESSSNGGDASNEKPQTPTVDNSTHNDDDLPF